MADTIAAVKPAANVNEEVAPGVWRSRHGFHNCSYETWLTLKRLRKAYWRAVRMHAEHARWERKLPKNRVVRAHKRNEKGQRCGYEIISPRPEPLLNSIFIVLNNAGKVASLKPVERVKTYKNVVDGKEVVTKVKQTFHELDDMGLLAAIERSRPVARPEDVRPMGPAERLFFEDLARQLPAEE